MNTTKTNIIVFAKLLRIVKLKINKKQQEAPIKYLGAMVNKEIKSRIEQARLHEEVLRQRRTEYRSEN